MLRNAAASADTMPGCLLYVASTVPNDADAVAVTEIWDDRASLLWPFPDRRNRNVRRVC